MKIEIEEAGRLIQGMYPEKTIILSHADHDGFTASTLLNLYFYKKFKKQARTLFVTKDKPYFQIFQDVLRNAPEYFVIVDALISKHSVMLEKIANKSFVLNMDHHDVADVHGNFLDINPHQWNIEYLNSSGLVWQVLRAIDEHYFDKRCWVAGIGAVQDYCIEDNKFLFELVRKTGLIEEVKFESIISSELMRIAKSINATIRQGFVEEMYQKIFEAALNNDVSRLQNDPLLLQNYRQFKIGFQVVYEKYQKEKRIVDDFVCFDFKGDLIKYTSDICETERYPKIYLGYSNGLLAFRALFYEYDVRKLAKLFGGGGPHPKVASGKTQKSFDEVIKAVRQHIKSERSSRTLSDFLSVPSN